MSNYSNSDIVPGRFYPLGAKLSAAGVNFALYSQYAKIYVVNQVSVL